MSKNQTEPDDLDVAEPDTVAEPADDTAPATGHDAIVAEWAECYDPGTELFVGSFGADDFDPEYGSDDYPDGTTIAVKRCTSKPTPGWIRKHAHLNDLERTFALLEMHACDEALEILDALKGEQWDEFVNSWGQDGGLVPKSTRSARRSANRKRR